MTVVYHVPFSSDFIMGLIGLTSPGPLETESRLPRLLLMLFLVRTCMLLLNGSISFSTFKTSSLDRSSKLIDAPTISSPAIQTLCGHKRLLGVFKVSYCTYMYAYHKYKHITYIFTFAISIIPKDNTGVATHYYLVISGL